LRCPGAKIFLLSKSLVTLGLTGAALAKNRGPTDFSDLTADSGVRRKMRAPPLGHWVFTKFTTVCEMGAKVIIFKYRIVRRTIEVEVAPGCEPVIVGLEVIIAAVHWKLTHTEY
jgi:hypothetical protein